MQLHIRPAVVSEHNQDMPSLPAAALAQFSTWLVLAMGPATPIVGQRRNALRQGPSLILWRHEVVHSPRWEEGEGTNRCRTPV